MQMSDYLPVQDEKDVKVVFVVDTGQASLDHKALRHLCPPGGGF
jgi:hypothetical protein